MRSSKSSQPPFIPLRRTFSSPSAPKSSVPGSPPQTIPKAANNTRAQYGSGGAQPKLGLFAPPQIQPKRTPSESSQSSDDSLPDFEPAEYVEEEPSNTYLAQYIGTAAFYKSRRFKKKEADGKSQVPGPDGDSAIFPKRVVEKPKVSESLVMIFGKTNVRRASLVRKYELRLQRTNRRM